MDPSNWLLELGETLVVYHPHAKLTPMVVPTRELAAAPRGPGGMKDLLFSDHDS